MTIIDDIIADATKDDASKQQWSNFVRQTNAFIENKERQDRDTQNQANLAIAEQWFVDTIQPTLTIPVTNRAEAKSNYNIILNTIPSNSYQKTVLGIKLKLAVEKMKEKKLEYAIANPPPPKEG